MHGKFARGFRREETPIARRRDAGVAAQILGEAFRAFQLRPGLRRPEGADAGGFQIVDQAGDERRFRADDDQIDLLAPAKATTAVWSEGSSGTHSAMSQMPAFPGAANSLLSSGEADSAQASACSRPPDPMRSTRIAAPTEDKGATSMRRREAELACLTLSARRASRAE
jgi:hypothetical protein